MAERRHIDAAAKESLRKWPKKTHVFGGVGERWWLRCQPAEGEVTHPRIRPLGSKLFATQPDGLFAQFGPAGNYVDIVAIEVCSSFQNLFDKRSRYSATTTSVVLDVPLAWWNAKTHKNQTWFAASGAFRQIPLQDTFHPIRHSRAIFILPNEHYADWFRNSSAQGHEFFMPLSSIDSFNSAKMQLFLARLDPVANFYSVELNKLGKRVGEVPLETLEEDE